MDTGGNRMRGGGVIRVIIESQFRPGCHKSSNFLLNIFSQIFHNALCR